MTDSGPSTEAEETIDVSPLGMWLALIGAAVLVVSMFLPLAEGTASFSRISDNTLIQHSEAWELLAFAVLIAASVYRAYNSQRRTWAPILLGVWALGVAIYLGTNDSLLTLCPQSFSLYQGCEKASPGIGVYAAGVGGILAIVGGWQIRTSRPLSYADEEAPREGPSLRKKCPDCAELVQPDARVCKHCGFQFKSDEARI